MGERVLRDFIEFIKQLHAEKYTSLIEKIRDKQIPIAVFSSLSSNTCIQIRDLFIDRLFECGFNLRYYFTPQDPSKENFSKYPALKVLNVSDVAIMNQRPQYVFIYDDMFAAAFVDFFRSFDIELVNYQVEPDDAHFNYYMKHLPEIFDVYKMFSDEESRRVYLAFILGLVSKKLSDFIFDEMPQYFLHGFLPKAGDILIDGGAFDGSSGSMFKKYGCEVYAFELDEKNFEVAKSRGDSEGFVVENLGLSDRSKKIEYRSGGCGSAVLVMDYEDEDKRIGNLISLDEYVREKNLPRIDFIKLDVEGSELDTLKGAALSIARWKPRLAISAYHKAEDLITIAKFLKKIRPDYEFAFRHYPTSYENEPVLFGRVGKEFLETFDLPLKLPYIWESVLYAR